MTGDIEKALAYCHTLFTVSPQWLVLSTLWGEYLGHVKLPEVSIEIERITALSAGAAGHYERHAAEYRLGSAQYGLISAEAGFIIYAFVEKERILCVMFKDAALNASIITPILASVSAAVKYLAQ